MTEETRKPRLLFLDDRTKRLHSALERFSKDYDVVLVCNVKECLRQLANEDFDVVHMDHDLRGVDFEDPESSECGMEVVRYLQKTGWPEGKKKPEFRVHSSNIFAGHLMFRELKKLGLTCYYERWVYDEPKHMTYDEKGLPIP